MIDSISHTLRGKKCSLKIGPKAVITGLNKSGKTSIVDAIALCLARYIPRLGKSNEKLEPIMMGDEATASITILGEVREFKLSKKDDGGLAKEAPKESLMAFTVDPSLYFGAKPKDRMTLIAQAANMDETKILRGLRAAFEKHKNLMPKADNIPDFVDAAYTTIEAELKGANAEKTRLKKAVEQAVADMPQKPPLDIEAHDKACIAVATCVTALEERQRDLEKVVVTEVKKPSRERSMASRASIEKDLEGFIADRDTARQIIAEIDDAKTLLDQAKTAKANLKETCKSCGSEIIHWDKHKSDMYHDHKAGLDAKIESLTRAASEPPPDLERLGGLVATHQDELRLIEEWDSYDAYLEASNAQAKAKAALEAAQTDLDAAKDNESTFKEAMQAVTAWNRLDKELASLKERRDTSARCHEDMKELRQKLDSAVTTASHQLMDPLLKVANDICDGIIDHPLECHRFVVGYTEGDTFVPIEGCCGAETKVITAAMQAALGCEIIIIDEAQMLDPNIFATLAKNLDNAIEEGWVRQAILVGSRLTKPKTGDWQLIKLERACS